MHHLLRILPVGGTLGVAALLFGSLPRLLTDLGASFLERLFRRRVSSSPRAPRGCFRVIQCGCAGTGRRR
jgi:hypothetical protein